MSKVRTPNYILAKSHSYHEGSTDVRTLDPGTFVRPIELTYVPKHITEDPENKGFDEQNEIYCYCRYGIIRIPRKIIREA